MLRAIVAHQGDFVSEQDAGHKVMPPEALCDLVMEGGITSGVVYPKAIFLLSKHYRFKNIGGTSAGAIAAAVTAAAEFRRSHKKDDAGFRRLEHLADELTKIVGKRGDRTKLLDLFVPSYATAPLMRILTGTLNRKNKKIIAVSIVWHSIKNYWYFALPLAALPLLALFAYRSMTLPLAMWWIGAALAIVMALGGVAYGIYRTLINELVPNGFGICKGYYTHADRLSPGQAREPLTLWLSRLINDCAGIECDSKPLTFGDLWFADGYPPAWLKDKAHSRSGPIKSIQLEVMTTSLTHGRPFRMPHADREVPLFFDPDELASYFPPSVVKHMQDHQGDYENWRETTSDPSKYPDKPANLRMLPAPEDLPVVFATRLSISFPILLSAVPLYGMDFEPKNRKIRKCWFSDGGIVSNFPIHFFDGLLPMWPTFGIQLGRALRYHPQQIFLPKSNRQGRGDKWNRFFEQGPDSEERAVDKPEPFEDPRPPPQTQLAGFALAIFDTSRNWRDAMQALSPAYRDRVVRVRLKDGQGGLNLNMDPDTVRDLTDLGERAGSELKSHFVDRQRFGEQHSAMDFDNHRKIRLRSLAAALEHQLIAMHRSANHCPGGQSGWEALIEELATHDPAGDLHGVSAAQKALLLKFLGELRALSMPPNEPFAMDAPKRQPMLRIVPDV